MKQLLHWNRRILLLALGMTLLFAVFGGTVTAAEEPDATVSNWAVNDLLDAETYGIYPLDWYNQSFRYPITQRNLSALMDAVESKLDAIGLPLNENYRESYDLNTTRRNVIARLYKSLDRYQWNGLLPEYETATSAAEYFSSRGLLEGYGTAGDYQLGWQCTTEQAVIFASRLITDAYQAADSGAKGFFWQVSSAENTLYLLGSIHIGDYSMYPLSQEIQDAYATASSLWAEVNLFDPNGSLVFMALATYPDGQSLYDVIDASTAEKLDAYLSPFGYTRAYLSNYKPWYVANLVSTLAASSSEDTEDAQVAAMLGVDYQLLQDAYVNGKQVFQLEGYAKQGQLFDNMSLQLQTEYLNSQLDSALSQDPAADSGEQVKNMQQAWIQGDLAAFQAIIGTEVDPNDEFSNLLLGQRDKAMTDILISLLEGEGSTTYFVVAGAAHFTTSGMILDQLSEAGYTVDYLN